MKRLAAVAIALGLLGSSAAHAYVLGKPVHGLTLYGEPKFPADVSHYPFVNPDAPKGGTMVRSAIGTGDDRPGLGRGRTSVRSR